MVVSSGCTQSSRQVEKVKDAFGFCPFPYRSILAVIVEWHVGKSQTNSGENRHPSLMHGHFSSERVGFDFCRVRQHAFTQFRNGLVGRVRVEDRVECFGAAEAERLVA